VAGHGTARERRVDDPDGDREQQETGHRDGDRYQRQRAARRVDPDDRAGLAERHPDPVREQRGPQLGDGQPRTDSHPAVLAQPAQRGRALGRGQPGQQIDDRRAADAFRLTV
jgi:hypothetical protein